MRNAIAAEETKLKNFMKIKLLFSIMFFIGFFGSISADPIDTTLAKTVAKNLYWGRIPIVKGISYSGIEPKLVYTRQEQGNDIYYVFNVEENNTIEST